MDDGLGGAIFAGEGLDCRRGERPVFAGLDFTIRPHRALLLTGPNGSGKSSLLRLMAGLLPPVGGRLLWAGRPVDDDPDAHRERVAYLGHRDAVKAGFSVHENLTGWAALLGGATSPAGAMAALERFGLDTLADLPARYLSAGQRRRLALARLLLAPRPLWLLDEPHAGLDSGATAMLERVIADHLAAGGLAAIASHGGLALAEAPVLDLAAAGRSRTAAA